MGCCFLEIGMTIMGIVTLSKGTFKLTRQSVIRGPRAYVIGILLASTFPAILCVGAVVGFMQGLQDPDGEVNAADFFWIDVVFVFGILAVVMLIALAGGGGKKRRQPQITPTGAIPPMPPPVQSDNPYASPQSADLGLEQEWEHRGTTTEAPEPADTRPPPPPPRADIAQSRRDVQQWYYSLDGKSGNGPIATSQLKQLIAVGTLSRDSLVSRDGKTWHAAGKLSGVVWP